MHNGDLAWADYDNDGDLDLALSGENVISDNVTRITEFYRNDPVGDLELDVSVAATPRVKGGSLAWADYDNDGNLDLALSGRGDSWAVKLLLYRNRPAGTLGPDNGFSSILSRPSTGSSPGSTTTTTATRTSPCRAAPCCPTTAPRCSTTTAER